MSGNKKFKVLVVGERCIDKFIYGAVERINPEAPVPILEITPLTEKKNSQSEGMAANVARNILSLSNNNNINVTLVCNERPISKTRYLDYKSGQVLLRVDENDTTDWIDLELDITKFFGPDGTNDLKQYDAVVISDYDKCFLDEDSISYIIKRANDLNVPSFLDTKKVIRDEHTVKGLFCLKLNRKESMAQKTEPSKMADYFVETCGEAGCCVYENGHFNESLCPEPEKVEVNCVSGAGDTVLAGLVVGYLETKNMKYAIQFANSAATEAVRHQNVVAVNRKNVKIKTMT